MERSKAIELIANFLYEQNVDSTEAETLLNILLDNGMTLDEKKLQEHLDWHENNDKSLLPRLEDAQNEIKELKSYISSFEELLDMYTKRYRDY